MRISVAVLLLAVFSGAGCKLLDYQQSKHFRFGTVQERDYSKNVHRTYVNAQQVLTDQGYSIRRAEMPNEDEAQIWASKNGVDHVLDIQAVGKGSKIRLEIDQTGSEGDAWSILNVLEHLP